MGLGLGYLFCSHSLALPSSQGLRLISWGLSQAPGTEIHRFPKSSGAPDSLQGVAGAKVERPSRSIGRGQEEWGEG